MKPPQRVKRALFQSPVKPTVGPALVPTVQSPSEEDPYTYSEESHEPPQLRPSKPERINIEKQQRKPPSADIQPSDELDESLEGEITPTGKNAVINSEEEDESQSSEKEILKGGESKRRRLELEPQEEHQSSEKETNKPQEAEVLATPDSTPALNSGLSSAPTTFQTPADCNFCRDTMHKCQICDVHVCNFHSISLGDDDLKRICANHASGNSEHETEVEISSPMEVAGSEGSVTENNDYVKIVEGCRIPLPENKGNMCFATTSMHCLLQLKPFCDVIESNASKEGELETKDEETKRRISKKLLEAQKDPQNNALSDIVKKELKMMKDGEQEDAEEFLQLLLQNCTADSFEVVRRVDMICTKCETAKNTEIPKGPVLCVPMSVDETNNLQAELGKMLDGTTWHECDKQKCRRNIPKNQKNTTIHQVVIIIIIIIKINILIFRLWVSS